MNTFPELLKQIRDKAGLTQEELARILDVSTILISMMETGSKEASKGFVVKLADKLDVRPGSLMPFITDDFVANPHKLSGIEKSLVQVGERFQRHLVNVKADNLKKYAR